jgi:hypothetical protein
MGTLPINATPFPQSETLGLSTGFPIRSYISPTGISKLETLVENFSSGKIRAQKWDNWGDAQITVVEEKVVLTSVLGGGYYGLQSQNRYRLTESRVSTELVDAGDTDIPSWEVYPIQVFADTDNTLQIAIASGNILCRKKVATVVSTVDTTAYDPDVHKWFRLSETGGEVFYEYSTDGENWLELHSESTPIDVSSVVFEVLIGTWQAEGSTTSAIIDNINFSS